MNILAVISKIIEKASRPGLLGVAGTRLEKQCKRDLVLYFRALKEKIPVDTLALLSTTEHDKIIALHAAEITIRNVLRKLRPGLIGVLAPHMMLAWKHGYDSTNVIREAHITHGPMDHLGPSGERAADYAATNVPELVRGLDETTLEALQDAISEGIEEQLGVAGTSRLIREILTGMSKSRADMIASTEMNRAMSAAAVEKLGDLGINYKVWVPVDDPCDICIDNEADGPIPTDETFSSGDSAPPAHPNCRCAVVGARAPEGEES